MSISHGASKHGRHQIAKSRLSSLTTDLQMQRQERQQQTSDVRHNRWHQVRQARLARLVVPVIKEVVVNNQQTRQNNVTVAEHREVADVSS